MRSPHASVPVVSPSIAAPARVHSRASTMTAQDGQPRTDDTTEASASRGRVAVFVVTGQR
ncbi:MAG: hypothetical protein U0R72_07485 [Nakamurella multipartita]